MELSNFHNLHCSIRMHASTPKLNPHPAPEQSMGEPAITTTKPLQNQSCQHASTPARVDPVHLSAVGQKSPALTTHQLEVGGKYQTASAHLGWASSSFSSAPPLSQLVDGSSNSTPPTSPPQLGTSPPQLGHVVVSTVAAQSGILSPSASVPPGSNVGGASADDKGFFMFLTNGVPTPCYRFGKPPERFPPNRNTFTIYAHHTAGWDHSSLPVKKKLVPACRERMIIFKGNIKNPSKPMRVAALTMFTKLRGAVETAEKAGRWSTDAQARLFMAFANTRDTFSERNTNLTRQQKDSKAANAKPWDNAMIAAAKCFNDTTWKPNNPFSTIIGCMDLNPGCTKACPRTAQVLSEK
mmetsp:Transcript_5583/g.8807  ORF Transcript_5583/g.8807 Transcript_5583/m.8807 type:complete len:353 (+) Transcript_5583:189-1247(+)